MENGVVKFEGENGLDSNLPDGFEGEKGEYIKDKRIYTVNNDGSVEYKEDAVSNYISEDELNIEETGVELIPKEDLEGDIAQALKDGKISAVLEEEIDGKKVIAVIPTGFTVSTIEGENTISGGLVVRDSNQNEFVWIPVPNISDMAELQDGSPTDYRGVLYNWWNDSTGQTEYSWSPTWNGYREPANLTEPAWRSDKICDSQEAFTEYGGGTWTDTMYQTEFNSMVESVEKYKGFYIGRYETGGFNTNKIVVKAGETLSNDNSGNSTNYSINFVSWYKAYKMQKEFASESKSVASTMIWGCQWDQVMKFVDDKKDEAGNTYDVTTPSSERHTGSYAATGNNINDKVQNIYDLEGNVEEWTLEAWYTNYRGMRGGIAITTNLSGSYAARRDSNYPSYHSLIFGSRAALYIR